MTTSQADYKVAQIIAPLRKIQIPEMGGTDNQYGQYLAMQNLMNGIASGSYPAVQEVTLFDVDAGGVNTCDVSENPQMTAYLAGHIR